ncbi:MAG: T9SS type A sorting domain-containing protein [Flavobacteriales bacterium]|nr:T9SS type A sorting domain-containing protein [Flavobacteriales bacterium]
MRSTLLIVSLFVTTLIHAQCLTFDGIDDQGQVPNTQLNAIGMGDFTVEAWINGVEAEQLNHAYLFSNRVDGFGFMLFFHGPWGGANYKMLCLQFNGVNYLVIDNGTFNGSLLDGSCHHVAITRQAGTLYFYADGSPIGNRIIDGTPTAATSAATASIGSDASDSYPFKGNISELRIWNYARTGAEIQGSMNVSVPANSSGLTGYWPMNDNGQNITDLTGTSSGFTGTSNVTDASDPNWTNNCCSLVPVEQLSPADPIRVYTNGSGQLVVEFPSSGRADVTIMDDLGRIVLNSTTTGTAVIDLRPLAAGAYVARVDAAGMVRAARFVVEGLH